MTKKIIARLLPVLGFLFLTAYIRSAACDVVYTDYMRLINTYLPDAADFSPYMHMDILTRVPISWIARLINVRLFGYSTMFDMILGAAGLTFAAFVIASYLAKRKTGAALSVAALFVVFSLDKWEMLTNGTGWVHFWAVGLFYYHYLVYDRVRAGEGKKGDERRLCFLPFVSILLFSGPYCVMYFTAVAAVYIIDRAAGNKQCEGTVTGTYKDRKKMFIVRLTALAVPFILYMISNHFAVYDYAGASTDSVFTGFLKQPLLFMEMLIKSFAGVAIGGETVTEYCIPDIAVILTGLIIMGAYACAIAVNFRSGLYKKTALPMLLLFTGLTSHLLIVYSRWIFLDPDYALSSRYALQYMNGALGILITFAMSRKDMLRTAVIVLILTGQLLTTGREIRMAKYRKEYSENMKATVLDYRNRSDEELKVLQYSHTDITRKALQILEENRLNVFR